MLNKKDPLIESVQKIMKENEIRRAVTNNLNEELGIQSINNLPHELHEKYTAILEQNITAALLGEKVEMSKQQFAGLDGDPKFTGKDLALARQGHHKKLAAAGKLEEQDPYGADTTSPSSMGIKKPDYAKGTPDYVKDKEQTVNRAEKTSLPPGTIKEQQLDELSPARYARYLAHAEPDMETATEFNRSYYRPGQKRSKVISKYKKGIDRADKALSKTIPAMNLRMDTVAKASRDIEPRQLQKLKEQITAVLQARREKK